MPAKPGGASPLPTYPFERQRYWIDAPAPRRGRDSRAAPAGQDRGYRAWFYVPAWTRTAAPRAPRLVAATGAWLVFVDDDGPGRSAGRAFDARWLHGRDRARRGDGSRRVGDDSVRARIRRSAADYDALVDASASAGRCRGTSRICGASSGRPAPQLDDFARAQDRGFYSVLFLTQALARQGADAPLDLTIVGDGLRAVDGRRPGRRPRSRRCSASAWCIPQEHPQDSVRHGGRGDRVDADDVGAMRRAAASRVAGGADWRRRRLSRRPALRAGSFEPAHDAPAAMARSVAARPGVYLITGGLGNIGLAIADRLARRRGRGWCWSADRRRRRGTTGRRGSTAHDPGDRTSQQIQAIRALEAAGRGSAGRVGRRHRPGADAGGGRAGARAVRRAPRRDPRRGAGGGVALAVATLDRAACERAARRRRSAACGARQATAGLALDFCLLTSSLSAILGGLGFAAYAAANQFLDSFAEAQAAAGRRAGSASTSTAGRSSDATASSAVGALEMLPAEGVESLARVLGDRAAAARGGVDGRSAGAHRSVRAAHGAGRRRPPAAASVTRYARPEIATAYHGARSTRSNRRLPRSGRTCWASIADRPRRQLLRSRRPLAAARPGARDAGGEARPHVAGHRSVPVSDDRDAGGASRRRRADARCRPRPVGTAAGSRAATADDAIAIIGMAGRFPGAPDLDAFWGNLRDGVESIELLERRRTAAARRAADQSLQQSALRQGGEHARRRRSVRRRRSSATRRAKPS